MKKATLGTLFLFIALFLSACTTDNPNSSKPTQETQPNITQYQEWKLQVEEITPRLKESLYDVYTVDLNVLQNSGTISAYVEVLSSDEDLNSFGVVVSLMGNCFIELTEEYSDYSFDHITFFYFYTNRNGKKYSETADITYNLNSDGSSTFLEPSGNLKSFHDKSPDEIYSYLVDNSLE